MNNQTDQQLLRAYVLHRSEAAFTELVRRHIDLVYSTARRLLGDAFRAEDVTQATFTALAQNAKSLTNRAVLSGWLHTTAHHLAIKTIRTDARRQQREKEAVTMNESAHAPSAVSWQEIAPHLDALIGKLAESERDAILLRYFEKKSAAEMGANLGISADAAQKRVNRAVEKLRDLFSKHGINIGAGGLGILISTHAVQAAPAGLALTISSVALAGTAATTSTLIAATKTMAMTTLQKTLVTTTVAVLAGVGLYEAKQAHDARTEMQTLRQQQAPLVAQVQRLENDFADATNRLANLLAENAQLHDNQLRLEVLKLRGDVTRFRKDSTELNQLKSRQKEAEQEVFNLSMARLESTMKDDAVARVEKMKARLGLTEAQAEAIKTALFAKAETMVQIYKDGANDRLNGPEQRDQFQKLNTDTDHTVRNVLDQNQIVLLEQMDTEAVATFARSWAEHETADINRRCNLTPEQIEATTTILASLPAEQGGPVNPALGFPIPSPDAKSGLERRLQALETVLTSEQLEKYRLQKTQEIEMYEASLRAIGISPPLY